jgi:hypothetical protein
MDQSIKGFDMILTALYAALTCVALVTIWVIGISLYGAHLSKLRDQRAKDGVNWSLTA